MANNSKSERAIKAFQNALIELYQITSIEKLTVEELVKNTDYSRSTFYFHFSNLHEFVHYVEQKVLEDLGPYFTTPTNLSEINAVRQGIMPKSCVEWLTKCKNHSKFLYASLGPHGNPSFVFNLRKVLHSGIYELTIFDGVADDAITAYVVEMLSGGVISMLYYYFKSGSESDFQSLLLAIGYLRAFRIRTKYMEAGKGILNFGPLDKIVE